MFHIILLLTLFGPCVVVKGFMNTELALIFFRGKHLKHNVVLTCSEKKGQVEILKNLTKEKDMVISVKLIKNLDIHGSIVFDYNKAGVVLDVDCVGAEELLIRSRRYRVFDTKTFWLMLHSSNNYGHLFRYVNLNVDSDIKVAYPANDSEISNKKYTIDDVYNQAYEKDGEFKSKEAGFYDTQYGYQVLEKENKYFVRRNLTGVKFRSAVVVPDPIDGSLDDYLRNDRDLELNPLNRFHARLMQYCRDYLNYR
ncbi:unnamed protein product [Ceutorhynchus assimilis]|uniref:Ionotropic receptor 75a N-terminal domain-containing protein n=1 Tax=Ceutorhynchus assimilis TaxID=467358 RepID=A0A9N9MZ33_9CUCU|nr:unnamed protein product [Ceutorhynchus assimilis]